MIKRHFVNLIALTFMFVLGATVVGRCAVFQAPSQQTQQCQPIISSWTYLQYIGGKTAAMGIVDTFCAIS